MLLSQLSKEGVFVIYMNLHPTGAIIYPPRDESPARILSDCVDVEAPYYAARCCSFFAAIFKVFRERLTKMLKDCDSYPKAMARWDSFMGKQTDKLSGGLLPRRRERVERCKYLHRNNK
jgi:hypothetical protein